ncbi:MAG: malate synthase, partial [Hyphomicrobiales bacterium]|nr:malate synthase [Hyphomicrobiales bacterium]
MTTKPKRKKKTRKKAAKSAAKKAASKTHAKKPGRRRKAVGPARAAKSRVKRKGPVRAMRRPLASAGRRLKSSARSSTARRARPRVAARRRVLKSTAGTPRVPGVVIKGKLGPRYREVLNPPALRFLADLHREFDASRERLLAARAEQQARYDAGELPDFRSETREIRDDATWRVNTIPEDLADRRVEITGPVDRKMIINALNSGANVYMADFEDANSPTWANNIAGQVNLKDLWAGKIDF